MLPTDLPRSLGQAADVAQILSAFILVAGIVVAFFGRLKVRGTKRLACCFWKPVGPVVVRAPAGLGDALEVRYKGERVDSLFVVRGQLWNPGQQPIVAADVIEPLTLRFADAGVRFLQPPAVVGTEPIGVEVEAVAADDGYALRFSCLNGGDLVNLQLVAAGPPGPPLLEGRLAGVSRIETSCSRQEARLSASAVGGACAGATAWVMLVLARSYLDMLTVVLVIALIYVASSVVGIAAAHLAYRTLSGNPPTLDEVRSLMRAAR